MLTEFLKYIQSQNNFGTLDATNSNPLAFPEGMELQSLERYSATRYRERYNMRTPSIDAFIDYTNNHRADAADVTTSVDPDKCIGKAIFNARADGEPGHCDDTATCALKPLPMYAFLMRIGESDVMKCSQRDVIDIVRDWHEHIEQPSKLAGAFAKLTIESVGKHSNTERDFGVEKSSMEKIDVKAEGAEVPADIEVKMIPYDGFAERTVQIGVSALVSKHSDEIVLRLRVRSYESLKLSIAQEFANKLTSGLDVKPIIGTIEKA